MEKLFVIKIGGNVLDSEKSLSAFLDDFAQVKERKVLIHGGGKIATQMGEKLGIQSRYVNGRRITDAETIDLVTMVYGGLVNKKLVAALQARHCNALGLTGADINLLTARRRPVGEVDYGFVGDIDSSRLGLPALQALVSQGITPVFAPLTHDGQGQLLNTNADTIASVLATGLSAHYQVRLLYCFEKKGVLENLADPHSVIRRITESRYRELLAEKKLFEGILPKIDNAFAALRSGVQEVLIGQAEDLLQNLGPETAGTLIN